MGNAERKFKDCISRGDEDKANDLYYMKFKNNKKRVNPNSTVPRPTFPHGISPGGAPMTLLQCCALHAMEHLYWGLLDDGGDVFCLTNEGESICHLICTCDNSNINARKSTVRFRMLSETIEKCCKNSLSQLMKCIDAKDQKGDTPLHKAAQSGLLQCVTYLVDKGCHLFAQNIKKQTACDVAGSGEVAQYLESKMVFAPSVTEAGSEEPYFAAEEMPTGLRTQDIQCVKDGMIVETADLLGVTLCDAEVLLRKHDWSKESLLHAWMDDSAATYDKAGLQPPQVEGYHGDLAMDIVKISVDDDSVECEICFQPIKQYIAIPCEHCFCYDCWKSYLRVKIEGGDTTTMLCPAYECYKFIPMDLIHDMICDIEGMGKKLLNYDLKAFVEGNPRLRWCPLPGCEHAVELPVDDMPLDGTNNSTEGLNKCRDVCCGNGHFFCWGCGEQPHEPCSCDNWKAWQQKIKQQVPNPPTDHISGQTAANLAWLTSHSKPCPNCSAPIQKNEGCNHMHCLKCKHDFCWMCMDPWEKHSSATGGYFDCNRYEQRIRSDTLFTDIAKQAKEKAAVVLEEEKFQFYYKHYINHYNNLQIEKKYTNMAAHKSQQWRDMAAGDAQFVEDAIVELRRSRHALMSSYICAYYIKRHMERELFEELQSGVETSTELLAEIIARPHLKTPRSEIIQITKDAHVQRLKFLKRLRQGPLAPVDESHSSRSVGDDDDIGGIITSPQQPYNDQRAAILSLLSHIHSLAGSASSSSDSIPSITSPLSVATPSLRSPQLLATPPPSNRVVYPPPFFVPPGRHDNEDHGDERIPFNAPRQSRRRRDSPALLELPTVNFPAPALDYQPTLHNPAAQAENNDDEFYEQLEQALALSLIENNPPDNRHSPQPLSPRQHQIPQQQQQSSLQQMSQHSDDYDEDEIRFQAELQLVLDISRAEQEPFVAQQEHTSTDPSSLMNDHHQLDTMATSNVGVSNNEHHFHQSTAHGYHGDYESDDYIELPGAHRRSPVFI